MLDNLMLKTRRGNISRNCGDGMCHERNRDQAN